MAIDQGYSLQTSLLYATALCYKTRHQTAEDSQISQRLFLSPFLTKDLPFSLGRCWSIQPSQWKHTKASQGNSSSFSVRTRSRLHHGSNPSKCRNFTETKQTSNKGLLSTRPSCRPRPQRMGWRSADDRRQYGDARVPPTKTFQGGRFPTTQVT